MRIGLALPHNTHLASLGTLNTVLDQADSAGWASLWVQDHIALPKRIETQYPYGKAGTSRLNAPATGPATPLPWWEMGSVLSYAAGRTSIVQLGTSVLVLPLRHPLFVAKMLATADQLSEGRVICGIGVGWMREEFDALGIGDLFPHRGRVADEYLEILTKVWAEDYPSHSGEFFRFDEVNVSPRPFNRAALPFWIGGNGRPAWRRTARFGSVWMPMAVTSEGIRKGREGLDSELIAVGRDPASVDVAVRRRILVDGFSPAVADDAKDSDSYLLGTPGAIVESIEELQGAGVSHLILDPWVTANREEALDMVAAIVQDILPGYSYVRNEQA